MSSRVYVAGHRGLLGSALVRLLEKRPGTTLVHPTDHRIDLRDSSAVEDAIAAARPDVIILSAAKVGGLGANLADPVGFLEDNLRMGINVVRAAFAAGVERLLFVGSANSYPLDAAQPIAEDALGTGAIDAGTESYGLSKLTVTRLCDAYRRQHGVTYHTVVPSNLYGPGDRFDLQTAHVVAATLRRFAGAVEAGLDEVIVWGSGNQRRQLLYSDDLARACDLLLQLEDPPSHINVGPRGDTTIREVAELAARTVGFEGEIVFDPTKPEGVARRELDTVRMHELGWQPEVDLLSGMQRTWSWFQSTQGPRAEILEGAHS